MNPRVRDLKEKIDHALSAVSSNDEVKSLFASLSGSSLSGNVNAKNLWKLLGRSASYGDLKHNAEALDVLVVAMLLGFGPTLEELEREGIAEKLRRLDHRAHAATVYALVNSWQDGERRHCWEAFAGRPPEASNGFLGDTKDAFIGTLAGLINGEGLSPSSPSSVFPPWRSTNSRNEPEVDGALPAPQRLLDPTGTWLHVMITTLPSMAKEFPGIKEPRCVAGYFTIRDLRITRAKTWVVSGGAHFDFLASWEDRGIWVNYDGVVVAYDEVNTPAPRTKRASNKLARGYLELSALDRRPFIGLRGFGGDFSDLNEAREGKAGEVYAEFLGGVADGYELGLLRDNVATLYDLALR